MTDPTLLRPGIIMSCGPLTVRFVDNSPRLHYARDDINPGYNGLAVLLDKPSRRHVALEPDYFGFQTASNQLWIGYGLAAANGTGRNARHLVAGGGAKRRGKPGRSAKKKG